MTDTILHGPAILTAITAGHDTATKIEAAGIIVSAETGKPVGIHVIRRAIAKLTAIDAIRQDSGNRTYTVTDEPAPVVDLMAALKASLPAVAPSGVAPAPSKRSAYRAARRAVRRAKRHGRNAAAATRLTIAS